MKKSQFVNSWTQLGAAVELARQIVMAEPDTIFALIQLSRKATGTTAEREALAAVTTPLPPRLRVAPTSRSGIMKSDRE
jgi:hypothetical protein